MIPYGHQTISKADIKGVLNVLKSDWLTQGPSIDNFEKALAKYCGVKYAIVCSNGTTGLHMAYLAAGLKAGDEAILTPNTFVATANMLLSCGVKPVFVDIRLDSYNLDESKIEAAITKKTKAIIPVHFAGQPCEMDSLRKIARKNKLLIIEDACHAIGAKYKNKKIGSIGDLTVFSFHPVKGITTGEGGAILTNNEGLYKKMRLLRSHGIEKDTKGFNVMSSFGYNYRMCDIQAALGLSQLNKIDVFVKKRHQVVKWYKKELQNIKGISIPEELSGNYSAWHIYVVRTNKVEDRLPLMEHLKKNGVGVNFHYPTLYKHPYYRKLGYKQVSLQNQDLYNLTAITLPIYPTLKKKEVFYISQKIKEYFNLTKDNN